MILDSSHSLKFSSDCYYLTIIEEKTIIYQYKLPVIDFVVSFLSFNDYGSFVIYIYIYIYI